MNSYFTATGTIATPPKLITTADGIPLCGFRLAVSERRFDRTTQTWEDGPTSWFSVTSFRQLGEHAYASFVLGERVIVFGKLRTRNWENGDRSGTSAEIEAEALGHELRWGTSVFVKSERAGDAHPAVGEAGWATAPALGDNPAAAPTADGTGITQN